MGEQAEKMLDIVRNCLDRQGWRHEYDPEKQFLMMQFSLDCKLQNTRLVLSFRDDGYSIISLINLKAEEQYRTEVLRYLTMANWGMRRGCFEMDLNDGEIRFRAFTNYRGMDTLPEEIVRESVALVLAMVNRYGDGLTALLMGFSTPEEEIKKAEAGRS